MISADWTYSSHDSVVLSFWVTSLLMVKRALDEAGIPSIQIDGSVPPKTREKHLAQFRTDENIKVLLITVSIGGVG